MTVSSIEGPAGRPLSAENDPAAVPHRRRRHRLLDAEAPLGLPNNFLTTLPLSVRYVTTAGWDQITGWGRSNTDRMVRAVAEGAIPRRRPSPRRRWWAPLPAHGTVDVEGRVAAPGPTPTRGRCRSPPACSRPGGRPASGGGRWPTAPAPSPTRGGWPPSTWRWSAASSTPPPAPYNVLDDPTARSLPEQDAFRIRVVVHADGDTSDPWMTAIDQRQAFAHDDADLVPGWPLVLGADGAGSPAFDDLDGDGRDELVIADGDGEVHAFRIDGTELPGWPVTTDPPPTARNPSLGGIDGTGAVHGAVMTGSPTIADLDGDGSAEIAATDLEGHVYVWSVGGERLGRVAGADTTPTSARRPPARRSAGRTATTTAPAMPGTRSTPSTTASRRNRSPPTSIRHARARAGRRRQRRPRLRLARRRHARCAGWPVLLRDPGKVAAVDPVTHRVDYVDGARVHFGRKIIAAPAVGDVDGDGFVEVAVNVNEQYGEGPTPRARHLGARPRRGHRQHPELPAAPRRHGPPGDGVVGGDAPIPTTRPTSPAGRCGSPWPPSSCCPTSARGRTGRRCSATSTATGRSRS